MTYEYQLSPGGEIPYIIRGWETQIYFKVYSNRRKYINGVQSGASEVVNVSATANSSAVTNVAVERLVNDSNYDYGVTVSFSQNISGSNRTISVKVTQSNSGKSDVWHGTQDGSAFVLNDNGLGYNYWFACTDDSYGNPNMPVEVRDNAFKFGSGYTFPIPVYRVYADESTFKIHMERAAYAYAGNTVYIKVFKSYSTSVTHTFQVTFNYGEISI